MTFLRSPINLDFAQKCHFTQSGLNLSFLIEEGSAPQVDSLVLEPTVSFQAKKCLK
jgi:hypothetical protein